MIMNFMRMADLGIVDFDFRHDERDMFAREIEENLEKVLMDAFTKVAADYADQFEIRGIMATDARKLRFAHTGRDGDPYFIDPRNESRGTMTYFSYMALLLPTLAEGGTIIVDELESSLHPSLAARIIDIFDSPATNPRNAQLIFATHSTNLLRGGELTRDQIWFTEKDKEGATTLYPLTDFRVRGSENFEKGYLQGRFGAIPYLGDLMFLDNSDTADGAAA